MLSYFEDTDRIGSAFHLFDGVRRYRYIFRAAYQAGGCTQGA
jgi:hypothetical protein